VFTKFIPKNKTILKKYFIPKKEEKKAPSKVFRDYMKRKSMFMTREEFSIYQER